MLLSPRDIDPGRRCRRRSDRSSAFTLLEILLVIALIGLSTGFLLTDWGNVAESFGRRNWKASLQESLRRGHFLAETDDRPVRLRFDPEERVLVLEDGETGVRLEAEPVPGVEEIRRVGGRGGPADSGPPGSSSPGEVFAIRFGRDGSAEAAVIEVRRPGGIVRLRNHPFSGRLIGEGEETSPLLAPE